MSKILVPYEAFRNYMTEYHNPRQSGTCKADGQDWPCDTYRTLAEALDSPDNLVIE